MNHKLAEKITLISMVVFAMLTWFIFDSTISCGILIGGLVGIINFKLLENAVYSLDETSLVYFSKRLRRNRLLRQCIYLFALLIAIFFPGFCNIFAVLGGILLFKVVLVIENFIKKEEGEILG